MALVTEVGTGNPLANSLCSLDAANAYHAARGNSAWDALDDTNGKAPALIRATDFLQAMFAGRWAGTRVSATQALDWPRAWVPLLDSPGNWPNGYGGVAYYATTAIPVQIVNAVAELALRAGTGPLLVDEGPAIKSFKEGDIGPVGGDTTVYVDGARQQKSYTAVEMMLRPFLSGGGAFGAIRVVRA